MSVYFDWLDLFIEANQGYIGAVLALVFVLYIMGKIAEWSNDAGKNI